MRWSLATSFSVHGAILVAALLALPAIKPFDVKPQEAIQVDISDISDQAQRVATSRAAETLVEKSEQKKQEETKPAPPADKVADKANSSAQELAALKPPDPIVKKTKPVEPILPPEKSEKPELKSTSTKPVTPPDPPLDEDSLAQLLKTAEPVQKPVTPEKPMPAKPIETKKPDAKPTEPKEVQNKVEKKKPKLDVDALDALLNKTDQPRTTTAKASKQEGRPRQAATDSAGNDSKISADIVDALVNRVRDCWDIPAGARDRNIVVRLHFALRPDGRLDGTARVENNRADPLFSAAAQSALSAMKQCEPYDFLPKARYDLWKDNVLDFNSNPNVGG